MNIKKALGSLSACLTCFLTLLLSSCGGSSNPTPPPPQQNPVPAIQSVSPSSIAAGSAGFTLTVNGSNFLPSSTLAWNGIQRNVTFVGSSQLSTAVSPTELASARNVQLIVSNPAPGGGQATTTFTVSPPAAPAVVSVSPNAVSVGGPAFTLTVTGNDFVSTSVVQWNSVAEPTAYVDNAHLTATIPASAIATSNVGNLPVTVATPAPGGGNSNSLPVLLQYPLPSISSLSPSAVVLGSSAFTLTVNGASFVSGATVYVNNLSRVTQFISSKQLMASVLASDLTGTAGNLAVTVQNPSPSAGVSNVFPFTLQNPFPIVASVAPSTLLAGNPTGITITGSGFVNGATIQVGGQSFPASFVGSTSINAYAVTVPVGSFALTITNPAPTPGPSNEVPVIGMAAGRGMSLIIASVGPGGTTISASGGALSSTGRYFAFDSYLRDTCLGVAAGCSPSTIQYWTAALPQFGLVDTGVSSNGRYVSSIESPYSGVYLPDFYDTCRNALSGCTPAMSRLPGSASSPASTYMTPSARYVSLSTAYQSRTPDTGPIDSISIIDTCVGAPPGCAVTQIPVATDQQESGLSPRLSDDGRYLAYGNSKYQVILHDSCLSAAPGCSPSDSPLTTGGCIIIITASISNDAGDVASTGCAGLSLHATCLNNPPSCNTNPHSISPLSPLSGPIVSSGGRFVSYDVANGTIGSTQLTNVMAFVYDSCVGAASGCAPQSVPVCLNASGAIANAYCRLGGMSSDGQYILFFSPATNLGPTDGQTYFYLVKNPLF